MRLGDGLVGELEATELRSHVAPRLEDCSPPHLAADERRARLDTGEGLVGASMREDA